jgi:hypothetical protein
MSAKFNLTAQLSLAPPTNVAQIVRQVNSQLQGIQMNINPNVNAKSLNQANQAVQSVGVSAKVTSKNLNTAAGSANSLGSALGSAARRFASITLATGFFLALTRALGSAVGRAIEFEKEMLKISQVTGKTVGSLSDLSNEVTRLSSNLGVSSEELLNAARTLSQAGFAAEKVTGALQILAQTDLAATFDSIKDTTEGAVAILSQFRKEVRAAGGEVQFLEMAMDSINAVSKSFAVESADLISVVRRTGGVFEAAGGKLNELIALFTSVRATTRETADTIATGFRTIFTRIQRTETIDSLRELGIVLQDTEGKFVGPMEAISRLSAGLKALDPRDFRFTEIVEQLGGFRQIGKVIPLIKQYETSTQALSVANNSLGSTARDAATAQQGLGNQFAQLKEKFDATVRSLVDSDTFQTLATSAIKMAEAILKIVDALEPLLPMLTALAAFKLGQIAVPAFGKFAGIGANAGGKIQGFAGGGMVPGRGNRDTVPAVLTPGEFVMRKSAVKKIGANNMAEMNNGYARGGKIPGVSYLVNGGTPASSGQVSGVAAMGAALNAEAGTTPASTGSGKAKADAALLAKPVQFLATRHIGGFSTMGGKEAGGYEPYALGKYGPENGFYLDPGDLNTAQRATVAKNRGLKPQELNKVTQFPANLSGSFSTYTPSLAALRNGPYTSLLQTGAEAGLEAAFDRAAGMLPDLSLPPALTVDSKNIETARASSINDDNARKSLEGFLGEGMLAAVSGAIPAQGGASFDLPAGSMDNSRKNLMAIYGGTAGALVKAEVKRSKANLTSKEKGLPKKTANDIMAGRMEGVIPKYAKGGQVDTVPAMLTPGEFVMKKSAAQGIGYSNLHRMNQSNGVNGYAAGGIVTGTRGSYGNGVPGGAGGGSIGTIPGIESASKGFTQLAKSIGDLVGQLIRAGENITLGTNSASEKLVQGANVLGGELSATGNRFISLPEQVLATMEAGSANFATAITDASKGISTVDNLLREAINGSLTQFKAAMADASKGISTVDNIMNTTMTGAMAPLKTSLTALDGEFKKFGTELKAKLVYFDVLKKANADLVIVMENLGKALMEKADDFDILKPPISAVEQALFRASNYLNNFYQIFAPLARAVRQLAAAMQNQARAVVAGGGGVSAAVLQGPMTQLAANMSMAAKRMNNIAVIGSSLQQAMANMVASLNAGKGSINNITINSAATSQELADLKMELAKANARILELETAAAQAATQMKKTGASAGAAGAGAAAGGGAMMGGMGAGAANTLMMAGMAASMLAQDMDGLSESTKSLITDLSMIGMMMGMLAMALIKPITSFAMLAVSSTFAANTVAQGALAQASASMKAALADGNKSAAAMWVIVVDKLKAKAGLTAAAADSAKAGAAGAAAGALTGAAIGATYLILRMKWLGEAAAELADGFVDDMKNLQQGDMGSGKNLAEYQAEIGKALQKEAEVASSGLWGTVGTVVGVIVGIAAAVAFAVSVVATAGATLVAAFAIAASAAAAISVAGTEIGVAIASAAEATERGSNTMAAAAFHASTALGGLASANKEMQFEMLEGAELLSRQTQAFADFHRGLEAASGQMNLFRSMDAGMDRGFRDDMMDSETFTKMKELGEDAMKELAKTAYEQAKSLQSSLGAAVDEFQESGMSFSDAMDTNEIKAGLNAFTVAVRDATAVNLMSTGQMRAQAAVELGLTGVKQDEMSQFQRTAMVNRERILVEQKANQVAMKARKAQEEAMVKRAKAEKDASDAAAQKLAADQEMARAAYRVASALSVFGDALMGLEKATAIVDVTFGRLSGTIVQFKNDTEAQIASLKSGNVTDESAAAARTVGSEFGVESAVEDVLKSLQETENLRKVLTVKGLEEFSGTLSESAANLRWEDFVQSNDIDLSGLSEDVRGQILDMLKDGLQPSEIKEIIGFVNEANKAQIEMLQKLAKARNNYLNHLFKFGAAVAKADKKFRDSIVRMTKVAQTAAERMAKATGRDVGVREVAGDERAARNANLGLGMRAGGPAGVGQQIGNRSNQISAIDDMISNLAETAGNDEQIIKLQNEQRKLAGESKQLTENLKSLANQTKLAAAIMSEIDKEKGKRDTIRGLISEFTFASNEERKGMDRNFMALQTVLQTGSLSTIPDEMRGAVGGLLTTLEDIAIGPQGQTGGEIKKMLEMQMANQLKIRATGKPLTAEEMDKIFNRTTKEEQLIKELERLGQQEQAAAVALAQQDHDAMRDLIGSIRELIVTLQNAQVAAGAQAGAAITETTLSAGGVVYAADGQQIFKPKGTDTVPAMLTPGEFVVNRSAAQKNIGSLRAMNSGKTEYLAGGGEVGTVGGFNRSAVGMEKDLTYNKVSSAALNAGKVIGATEQEKLAAVNEKNKDGISGSSVFGFLKESGVPGTNTYFGSLKDVYPVNMGGGWDGSAHVRNQTLSFIGLNNKIANLAKEYVNLKRFQVAGGGGPSDMTGTVGLDAVKAYMDNYNFFWKGGWANGVDNDLAEYLDDSASEGTQKAWASWENYDKLGFGGGGLVKAAPKVFSDDYFRRFYLSFLDQGSPLQHMRGWFNAEGGQIEPEFSTYDVADINAGKIGNTIPSPKWVEGKSNKAMRWSNDNINWPSTTIESAGFSEFGMGGSDLNFNNLAMARGEFPVMTAGFKGTTEKDGQFNTYGRRKVDLLTAAYSSYAYWLDNKMTENAKTLGDYFGGKGGFYPQEDPDGNPFVNLMSQLGPQNWLTNTPEGQKAAAFDGMLAPGGPQELVDKQLVKDTQLATAANNWSRVFGYTEGLGITDSYKLETPEFAAIRTAGNKKLNDGFGAFNKLIGGGIPAVGPDGDKVPQIDEVVKVFEFLKATYGLKNNFANQFKVAQDQAAEAQAVLDAEAQEEKEGFLEENIRLNANMDFGIFNNRAGFMEEAKAKMMDDKIFNTRTPRYAFKLGVPTSATRLHKIPPTAKNFDALFPFSMLLAKDLQNMTKGNLLSSLDGKGIKYNVGRIMGQLGNVVDDGAGNPIFEGARGAAGVGGLNNIINTIDAAGNWDKLSFIGGRKFFGPPGPSKESGLVGTYGSMPYPSWYSGMFKGYKGLSEEEVDVSSFYFKDAIAAGGLPKQVAGETQGLWKMIMDRWTAGVAALRPVAGPQGAQAAGNFATGGPVGIDWSPRGTDTVPAMLTPGEFVMKKSAVDKYGMGFMSAINEGRGSSGGYMATGGSVSQFGNAPDPEIQRMNAKLSSMSSADAKITKVMGMQNAQSTAMDGMSSTQAAQAEAMSGMPTMVQESGDMTRLNSNENAGMLSENILEASSQIRGSVMTNRELIVAGFGSKKLVENLQQQNVRQQGGMRGEQQGGRPLAEAFNALMMGHNVMGLGQGFAKGGAVGTDTVPAMLTPGEFVMKKNAVDKYGSAFMSSINNGSVRGFSGGGPVYLHEGGSPGSAGGNIEMPSFGDVIDNFDTVFQTYGDTAFLEVDKVSRAIGSASNNIAIGTKDLAAQFPAVTSALNNLGSLIGGDLSNAGSIISSSLASFTEAFTLFSGLSSMLSNTINSMADMNITHNININGSLAIPGFSQEDIDGIIANISNGVTRGVDEKIKQAFAQRDTDEENRIN